MPLFAADELIFSSPRATTKQPSYIRDHRKRLRDRFLSGGADALPDYEMLELVLFRAIPRLDVKPLAHDLLEKFFTFNDVVSAPVDQLNQINGVGEAVICELKIVEASAHRLARSRMLGRPVVSSWSALIDYCHTRMAHKTVEQFRIFFLDTKNTLLADEEQARGTVNHVPVYPREVVKRALQLDASALILVHNHPSGDPTPSEADIAVTLQIKMACETLGLILHDHVIIGKSCEVSFQAEGLI